jgi:hypothetical protein
LEERWSVTVLTVKLEALVVEAPSECEQVKD